jgi:hypothetical protein
MECLVDKMRRVVAASVDEFSVPANYLQDFSSCSSGHLLVRVFLNVGADVWNIAERKEHLSCMGFLFVFLGWGKAGVGMSEGGFLRRGLKL